MNFNIINKRTDRDFLQRKTISWSDFSRFRNDEFIPDFHALWNQNVALFSVSVINESDEACSVWIVFNRSNCCRDIFLVIYEIDIAIEFFISTSLMANRDAAEGIA